VCHLVQIATIGLIKSVERYNSDPGSHFLSLAIPTMTGEIRQYFRDHTSPIRVPRTLQDPRVSITRAVPELTHQLGRLRNPARSLNG